MADSVETIKSFRKLPLDSEGNLIQTSFKIQSPRNLVIISYPKSGKALTNDTPVLTRKGWTDIAGIKQGDRVFGSDGRTHKVTGVFPQGQKKVYTITFMDGTSVSCSEDHLWKVWCRNARSYKTLSTSELSDGADYSIPIPSPIQFTRKSLPVHPYIIGTLIGDGGLTQQCKLTIGIQKESILERFKEQGYSYKIDKSKNSNVLEVRIQNIYPDIVSLGLNKISYLKCIPEDYLSSSVEDRIALLQGLMDTDGTPCDKGGIEFSTTSAKLAKQVGLLVKSLGGRFRTLERMGKYNKGGVIVETRNNYRVFINFPYTGIQPFYLESKRVKFIPYNKGDYRLKIKSIEYKGIEECTCISVDSEDHLYICKDYNLTHNTDTMQGEKNILIGDPEGGTDYFEGANTVNLRTYTGDEAFIKAEPYGYIPAGLYQTIDELRRANRMTAYFQLQLRLESSRDNVEREAIHKDIVAHLQSMPFPIFAIDTITNFQELNLKAALEEYNHTVIKDPAKRKKDIKKVDDYGGVQHIRRSFDNIKRFIENNAAPFIIWTGHIKERKKILEKDKDEVSAVDIALDGILSTTFTSKADAVAILYRNKEGVWLDFRKKDEEDTDGRPRHLGNQLIKLSDIHTYSKEGKMVQKGTTHWSTVYPELKW